MTGSLLAELKRRNVFRVAAAYSVLAWLLIQISTTVLPLFGAPDWIARVLVVVLALGFVPVLMWAWVFELTSEGLKTQDEADAAGLSSRLSGRRPKIAIAAMLLVAVALFALGRYSGQAGVTEPAPDADGTANMPASIAVLPFVNMSADKDNEYFSDGLSETLLNMLAQVPDLKVAGRTSSFAFKGRNEDLRKIGSALGVANVLEGSVQRVGETVRITAQLIAVSDGTHRWSKSYDRKLDDVFRIQDEIATEVVGALRVALQPAARERLTLKRTENVAAYEEYLKGVALLPRRKVAELRQAAKHFERAIELDPGFARAYVGAADTYLLLDAYDRDSDDLRIRAKRFAERAMELSPTLGDAHATLAFYLMAVQNREHVESELKRAIELAPSYASAYHWYAWYLRGEPGRAAQALAMSEKAAALDPLSPILRRNLAQSQAAAGKTAEGRATSERLVREFPDYSQGHLMLADIAASEGDLVTALRAMRTAEALDADSISNRVRRVQILTAFGAIAQANEYLGGFVQQAPDHGEVIWQQAYLALIAGDAERAISHLERTPRLDRARFLHMRILLDLGRAPDALEIARRDAPDLLADAVPWIAAGRELRALLVASILLRTGQEQRGRVVIARVLQTLDQPRSTLEADWPWIAPIAHALLGDRDKAVASLAGTVARGRFTELPELDADILQSGLRDDPRYEATVAPARARAAEQVRLAEAAGLL